MAKADKKSNSTKPKAQRDYRTKPVEFGFVDVPQELHEAEQPEAPLPPDTPAQRQHDAFMADKADLERTILQTLIGEYVMPPKPRGPKENTRNLMTALAEAFPDGQYPRGWKVIQAKLAPIYKRNGWPMPDAIRNAISEATKGRRSKA